MLAIARKIADELQVKPNQIEGAMALLDEGATVPFIARYRKEVTGGLDDTQLRNLSDRLGYLRELEERRQYVLGRIEEQGKLTQPLKAKIVAAESKQALEDLYLPFKSKRKTKAQIAKDAGLAPLAKHLASHPAADPQRAARPYCNPDAGFEDADSVLEGARAILAAQWSEDIRLLEMLRNHLERRGVWEAKVTRKGTSEGDHFRDYFDHREAFRNVPSHRALAMFRGEKEGMLRLNIQFAETPQDPFEPGTRMMAKYLRIDLSSRGNTTWLQDTVQFAWKNKLHPHLKSQFASQLREKAEAEAIQVFAKNLKDLLLAPPAGQKTTMGLDPGFRTGVKVAVVDPTGKLVEHTTIFPHPPQKKWSQALSTLNQLCQKHRVALISIGNGTASRETERLVAELKASCSVDFQSVVVSESGASVYSASALAADEFPNLDVSFRGAVSIARRLQDPLAELVKIDPKAIGVGQYQHDLAAAKLNKGLEAVIEDCVNAVGVMVNTASAPLLTHVSGLSSGLAQAIVAMRETKGPFQNRKQLLQVPRLGPKAFEQAAGFLRIRGGSQPLDASAVHPESYGVVQRIAKDLGHPVKDLIGKAQPLRQVDPSRYVDDRVGLPTVRDILMELEKPGRDPRPSFQTAAFAEGVESINDLEEGMILEGVVRNVANFGAFVDIGVHQDGLVHISAMANRFVKDPREVVRAGQIVKVKVIGVDAARKRIGLTMRLED